MGRKEVLRNLSGKLCDSLSSRCATWTTTTPTPMPSPSNAAPASPRAPPQYPDCVVAHLLANDDGPIDLVSLAVSRPPSATERTISLFYRAGLLDDPIQFVDIAVFGHGLEATVGAVP